MTWFKHQRTIKPGNLRFFLALIGLFIVSFFFVAMDIPVWEGILGSICYVIITRNWLFEDVWKEWIDLDTDEEL